MANNILRLTVEDSEYNAKLKKAVEGIQHLAEVAHRGAGDMAGLEKSELDYIKALGDMETKSRSAAGSTRELENAYKELTVIYNNLNEVEKADEGGKALAASLETLKQRAIDARAQLDIASQSLKNNETSAQQDSSILDQLASKFTVNIDALKLFDMGLSATKAALDVAKDAFFASEANVDEWGRTVAASQSLYEGFLTALNTGDISGYLSRIDEIVSAARTAYNELDRLGTMKTIQAPKVSAQQTENERIRNMIQTGRYIAPVDGRKNAVFNGKEMQNGDKLTAGQIRALEKQLQNGMQNVVKLVGNEVKQTGKAIDAVYERQAKELGISLKEFRKGTSSMEEFDKRMAGYDKYQQWREQHTTIDQKSGRETVARGNPYAEYGKWGTFRVDGDRYNQLVQLIQQRDQQAGQAYSMQSQSYRTMNRAEGFTVSKLMGRGGSGSGSKNTPQDQAEKMVSDALLAYQQTIDKARLEMDGGIKSDADVKKTNLSAQERLYDAYGKAYATYADPKYKEAQDAAAAEIVKLGGEVKTATEAQKAAEQAARELEQAQKKLIEATGEAVKAGINNDLKGYYQANKAIVANGGTAMQLPIEVTYTDSNLQAFIGNIKERLSQAEVGSDLYNALTAQLADATMLGNFFSEAIKNGIDMSDIDPQEIWKKIFGDGETAGDFITDKFWENLGDSKKMKVNTKSGDVKEKTNEKSVVEGIGQLTGGMQQMVGSLQQLGIDIPAGLSNVLGGIQAVCTILTAISTIVSAIEVITTADTFFPFARGGIVPHAANGYFVSGNNFSGDTTPILANAGELVLNKSSQNNLASMITEAESRGFGGNGLARVSGEQIWIAVNAYTKRSGKGELVTWK